MKRIPVQIQLFIILFSILVIPMSIITFYTNASMMKYSEAEIAESTISRTTSNSQLVNMVFNEVMSDILKLVKENKFNIIKDIESYEQLTSNFDSINHAVKLMDELQDMQINDSVVYSVMYYVDNADYVLSTNKGIVPLQDYEDLAWLADATSQIKGASSVWYPRYLNSSTVRQQQLESDETTSFPVISFVYRLNRLTTSAKGTIVINMYEEKIQDYLSVSGNKSSTNDFIINNEGMIISHKNKDKFLTKIEKEDVYQHIQNSTKKIGYEFTILEEERILYTYNKEFFNGWTYITTYSMDTLLEQFNSLRLSYVILTIIMFILGTIFTFFATKKFVQPVKRLVKEVKSKFNYEMESHPNELVFLDEAFGKIREEEQVLHQLLKDKTKNTKSLIIQKLLSGDGLLPGEEEEILEMFPYHHFLVAIISIDEKNSYLLKTNVEARNYHRFRMIEEIELLFSNEYKVVASRYQKDEIAIIINIENYDQRKIKKSLDGIFNSFKALSKEIINKTVTIAVSGVHTEYESISDCTTEAREFLQQRLVKGKNSILYYDSIQKDVKKLVYSYNTEKKILNYLVLGDIEHIEKELYDMAQGMKELEDITNDNIMLNYNQLVGATMKYLVENNINSSKILGGNMNLYSAIGSFDTIDEIRDYLIDIYGSILEYNVPKENFEPNHFEKIMKYLSEHYNEELVLEDVASQIGISYSYLRKLVKEETGRSVIDNINLMRIEQVKRLLLNTEYNMTEIAEQVGYRNVQSVNRFFKKYEGISPSEFKSLNKL